MARPKKETVDYFPHYANGGKTIFILESKFGNNGYAFWFKLLEILAITEGHYFRAGNSTDWEFLMAKTKVNEETAIQILDTLANLEAIDKELWSEKVIWVQKFVDNLTEVYRKRKVSAPIKPLIDSFCDRNPTSDNVTDVINPQSKVKESKVKESKVNNNNSSSLLDEILDDKLKESKGNFVEVVKYFEKCGFRLTPLQLEEIKADMEIYTDSWLKDAAKESSNRGKLNYSYVKGILSNWLANGRDKKKEGDKNGQSSKDLGAELRDQGIGL